MQLSALDFMKFFQNCCNFRTFQVCRVKQMTGFYMKYNTGPKSVNKLSKYLEKPLHKKWSFPLRDQTRSKLRIKSRLLKKSLP